MAPSWEDYLYPGTDVLRNNAGLRRQADLEVFERSATARRAAELGASALPGSYDLDHLKRFHGQLFQDVYPWAGELRQVNITKGDSPFCRSEHIESYSAIVFTELARDGHLQDVGRKAFVERAAHYLAEVNAIHPFRDGNGRAQRAFFSQLARDGGRHLAWERLDLQRNIAASRAAHRGDERPMRAMINDVTESLGRRRARELAERTRTARQRTSRGRGGRGLDR